MRDRLQSDRCSRALKALADPDRLRIVQCLGDGPRTVSQVGRAMGLPIANVSHHLLRLREAGLVVAEKRGRSVAYALAPGAWRATPGRGVEAVDLGCCRLELGESRGSGN